MNTPCREETLFQAAAALPGTERNAFLDRECAGDPALRARLDALLAAHEQSDGVLAEHPEASRPTVTFALHDLPDLTVGTIIGRFVKSGPDGLGLRSKGVFGYHVWEIAAAQPRMAAVSMKVATSSFCPPRRSDCSRRPDEQFAKPRH